MRPDILDRFATWLSPFLAESGDDTVAFLFNLYEHEDSFAVQIAGASRFDSLDASWTDSGTFTSGENLFELSHAVTGHQWESALISAKKLIAYHLQYGQHRSRLHEARAVVVGFVDGDLETVHETGT